MAQWETAEITWGATAFCKFEFFAIVNSPRGRHDIFEPKRQRIQFFDLGPPHPYNRKARQAHERLVQKLLAKGWEPNGQSDEWW